MDYHSLTLHLSLSRRYGGETKRVVPYILCPHHHHQHKNDQECKKNVLFTDDIDKCRAINKWSPLRKRQKKIRGKEMLVI